MTALIRHGACGRGWTGSSRGHCSGCHETFTAGAFDKHQRQGGERTVCLSPAAAGLVARAEPWGTLWALPDTGYWSEINAHHPGDPS